MGRREKLIAKLRSVPADFTWQDLKVLLKSTGLSGNPRKRFEGEVR